MAPWWTPARIDAVVNRQFVAQHLKPEEIDRLNIPAALRPGEFADRTYWDCLQHHHKRIFLILVDLGIPGRIFRLVDGGWDDPQLPLSSEEVARLPLTGTKEERLDRKFYSRQFSYALKILGRGDHRTYSSNEIVPLEVVDRFSNLKDKQKDVDKVKIPNESHRVFTRRRFRLKAGGGGFTEQEFEHAVAGVKAIQNDHIVSYWASYIHEGSAYILVSPSGDLSLKSFLSSTPSWFKALPKTDRRKLVLDWIMCLSDTVAYLHNQSRSHCHIKPSTVSFNKHIIVLADSTRLNPDSAIARGDKLSFDREGYDYAAPEQWYRPMGPIIVPGPSMPVDVYSGATEQHGINIARGFDYTGFPNHSRQNVNTSSNPQLNPQHADVFSLGCIMLELLSFLAKQSTSKFATFRSAKHKTAGRGGAVLDASFHRNLTQVEAWMSNLAREASKKSDESDGGKVFCAFVPLLHLITGMLSANPEERPLAVEVRDQVHQILAQECGMTELHCVHAYPNPRQMNLQAAMEQLHLHRHEQVHDPMMANHAQPYPMYVGQRATSQPSTDGRPSSSDSYSQVEDSEMGSISNISSESSDPVSDFGVSASSRMREPMRMQQATMEGQWGSSSSGRSYTRGPADQRWQSAHSALL